MRQTTVGIYTKDKLTLDGVFTTPWGNGGYPTILVCHPHEPLGGDMGHPVVRVFCYETERRGFTSLGFSPRGMAQGEGAFDDGWKGKHDLKNMLGFLKSLPNIDGSSPAVTGYFSDASTVLYGLKNNKAACSFALVGSPTGAIQKSQVLNEKRPKLFLVEQYDRVIPSLELQRVFDNVRAPVQFAKIHDADHTLLGVVAERDAEFLPQTLN